MTKIDSLKKAITFGLEHIKNNKSLIFVHCAGHASDIGSKNLFKLTNYVSVQHITKLIKEFSFDKFIFVSTTDVYGLSDFNGQNEEELDFNNNRKNHYPEFKIKFELWIRQQLPADKYIIIRPAAVWGPGDKTLTPRITKFLQHSPFIIHFGNPICQDSCRL